MKMEIEVAKLDYDDIAKWMRQHDWYVVSVNNLGEVWKKKGDPEHLRGILVHLRTLEGKDAFDDEECAHLLKYLNFGHPSRTILELWAEVQGVPAGEMMDWPVEQLLEIAY